MSDARTMLTAEQLSHLQGATGPCELVRGELVREPSPGAEHGWLAMRIGARISNFVEAQGLGFTFAAETGFLIGRDPDTVRAPDVAFVARERAIAHWHACGYIECAPDLVVEVLSPSDRQHAVRGKIIDWLGAASRIVMIVDPIRQSVTVHRSGVALQQFAVGDVLTLPEVLPGFECAMTDLFAH